MIKLGTAARNAVVNAVGALCSGTSLRFYSGTVPTSANDAITTQVLLATLTMGSPAFGAASGGQATANTISEDVSADASGVATFFRVVDGATTVLQGTVGGSGSGADLEFPGPTAYIVTAAKVAIPGFVFAEAE